MDRNLALEFVRVTEAAAIAAARWVGKGEAKLADGAAVDAMPGAEDAVDPWMEQVAIESRAIPHEIMMQEEFPDAAPGPDDDPAEPGTQAIWVLTDENVMFFEMHLELMQDLCGEMDENDLHPAGVMNDFCEKLMAGAPATFSSGV